MVPFTFLFEEGVVLIDEDVVIDILIKYFERILFLKFKEEYMDQFRRMSK